MSLPQTRAVTAPRVLGRSAFLERLESLAGSGARNLGLVLVKATGLGFANEVHGPRHADDALEALAVRFSGSADRALEGASARAAFALGRLGSVEFAVLLEDVNEPQATAFAERLHAALSDILEQQGGVRLGLAAGCAHVSACETGATALYAEAHAALRSAEALGGERCVHFPVHSRAQLARRAAIARELPGAIEAGRLGLVYQPIVNLESSRIEGYEALARWTHPVLGEVSPAEFVPLAAASGSMASLGEWALRSACREFARLRATMHEDAPRFVAVNVSRRTLDDSRFRSTVLAALADSSLNPACLHLEITESELAVDQAMAQSVMRDLRSLGVGVAIDDFGVGYSSLASLQEFPVDVLKLDRCFLATHSTPIGRRGGMAVMHAMINLARNMGMRIVAEGVETLAQLALLHSLRCDLAQGYLLGRPAPLPAARISRLVS